MSQNPVEIPHSAEQKPILATLVTVVIICVISREVMFSLTDMAWKKIYLYINLHNKTQLKEDCTQREG